MDKNIPLSLLQKYLEDICTEAEAIQVETWYLSVGSGSVGDAMGALAEDQLKEKIYQRVLDRVNIKEVTEPNAFKPTPRHNEPVAFSELVVDSEIELENKLSPTPWYIYFAVAVSVLLFIVVDICREIKRRALYPPPSAAIEFVDVSNTKDQILKATLPDNSNVWLRPHAQLKYPKVFNAKYRQVTMSGECFFEVTKNGLCPFIIRSPSIVTRVWGTSFLVHDLGNQDRAVVTVLTGKVSVSIKKLNAPDNTALLEKGEVMLYPHQKVTYLNSENTLKTASTPGNSPEVKPWTRVNLNFDNKPLSEIIPVLSARFGVQIRSSNRLGHYILNADMTGFNLPDVLEALKRSLNITYQFRDQVLELE